MSNSLKVYFQDIHYLRKKPSFFLNSVLSFLEFFYKTVINLKNYLYEKNILKENRVNAFVVCVGNLTTGGVGKTPTVINLANFYSKNNRVAIISRGYGAKLSNKKINIIKDYDGLKFENGALCGDEPYQTARAVNNNVVVITSKDRLKAANLAIQKYGTDIIILDDGFSNRKIKKDKTLILIDSKMRFGNNHLLPSGPLREPVSELNKRADEIILVNKADENINSSINWAKENFKLPIKLCNMKPKRIYNIQTHANILNPNSAIAFCAIGQSGQFFNFAKQFYNLKETVSFCDHHKYTKKDILNLITLAKKHKINTFITTQKDEAKLTDLIKDIKSYSFNVLELEVCLSDADKTFL